MSLNTRSTWISGSYPSDLQYFLEIAEESQLQAGTSTKGLHPERDSERRLVIGFGYDLYENVQHDGKVADASGAISDLKAAGASITDESKLKQLLEALPTVPTDDQMQQISALLSLPNVASASSLLDISIASRQKTLNSFLTDNKISIGNSDEMIALMDMWYQGQKNILEQQKIRKR